MAISAAQVFDSLEKSSLLGPAELANARQRWNKPDRHHFESSQHCVKWLVTNHFLTPFQGDRLLEGKSESLRVDGFVIREKVAEGTFAGGYIGQDQLSRQVIIQWGPASEQGTGAKPSTLAGLEQAVSKLEKLNNHHIQKAVGCGIHQGRRYIAWQWWDGCTLGAVLVKKGKVEPHKACKIFATVMAAAQALHEAGLPLGLVDLDSIFLAIEPGKGEGRVVKVLRPDIGTSWEGNGSQPSTISHAEEVYSIGKAMYRAITGYGIPEGGQKRNPVASMAPDVPEHIADYLDQLTDPEPGIRYSDAKVAGKALRILIATEDGDSGRAQDHDPLMEVKGVTSAKAAEEESGEGDSEEDWFSGKINTLLQKVGISPRELIFLSGGALATVMVLLLGLWLVGDIMPLIALGLGAMGGYYLNAWLAKKTQAE